MPIFEPYTDGEVVNVPVCEVRDYELDAHWSILSDLNGQTHRLSPQLIIIHLDYPFQRQNCSARLSRIP